MKTPFHNGGNGYEHLENTTTTVTPKDVNSPIFLGVSLLSNERTFLEVGTM